MCLIPSSPKGGENSQLKLSLALDREHNPLGARDAPLVVALWYRHRPRSAGGVLAEEGETETQRTPRGIQVLVSADVERDEEPFGKKGEAQRQCPG